MTALGARFAFALAAALAAALLLGLVPPRPAEAAEAQAPRQILVMLRAPAPHVRPNSDYAGAYGDAAAHAARLRAAARLSRDYGLALVSDWPMPVLGLDCLVMSVPADQTPEAAAARLSQDPGVSWSEPIHLYQGEGAPGGYNDPLYGAQPAATEWRLSALHQIATGRNVRIAVIDGRIERDHPDLAGQVETAQDFVDRPGKAAESHGTGVAGVIAARMNNGMGIAGIAPRARLMALRACWQDGGRPGSEGPTVCDSLSLARALSFAIEHGAQVVNLSLSGPPDRLLSRLIDVALSRGMVVVVAADPKARDGGFPASHRGVVAVAAEGAASLDPSMVAAPGHGVPTTRPGGRWSLVDGSSYAAAHVSGLFALLRERTQAARGAEALVLARPRDTIDACATLLRSSGPCNCACVRPRETLAALPK